MTIKGVVYFSIVFFGFLPSVYAQPSDDQIPETRKQINLLLDKMKSNRQTHPQQAIAYGRQALQILENSPDPVLEIEVLSETGWAFYDANSLDSALFYSRQVKKLARTKGHTGGIARALHLQARIFRQRGHFDKALPALDSAVSLTQDQELSIRIFNEKGSIYRRQGDYEKALGAHRRALQISRKIDSQKHIANTLSYTGIIYDLKGNYDQGLSYHHQSLEIREKLNDRRGVAGSLHNIGILYQKMRDYDLALQFYRRALPAWKELGLRNELATTLNSIGAIYDLQDNYQEALSYYQQALTIWEDLGDQYRISIALNNVGSIQQMLGNHDTALQFHYRALDIRKQLGDRFGISSTLNNISGVYQSIDQPDSAVATAQRALSYAEEIGSWLQIEESHERLSEIYESQNQFSEALDHYKKFKLANDSLFNRESQSIIAELQEQYRTKEQQQQIELLQRERQIHRLWMGGLAGGILLIGLVTFLIYSRYRIKNRAHQELERAHEHLKNTQQQLIQAEKMATIGKLAAGLAHEINNPNGAIIASNNNLNLGIEKLEEEIQSRSVENHEEKINPIVKILKNNTGIIKDGATRINHIVQSLKKFTRFEESEFQKVDIHEGIDSALVLITHELENRIKVSKKYEEIPPIYCYPAQLNQALMNVLTNAVQAIHSEGEISIETSVKEGLLHLKISDTGEGMSQNKLNKIFDFEFSHRDRRIKMGSGLMIAHNIIQKHKGDIKAESQPGKGSTFTFILPTDLEEQISKNRNNGDTTPQ